MSGEAVHPPDRTARPGTFLLIWSSQAVSLLGTRMSNFVLGVWVYQETHSVTRFTLITAIGLGAGLLASPFLGVLVDRWDRRWAMFAGDAAAGVRTLVLLLLVLQDDLQVWHVYVAVVIRTVAEAIQLPAYQASITLLVPPAHRGRANGLLELGGSGTRVLAPAVAGVLMMKAELESVLLVDLATFLVAMAVLVAVRIPRPRAAPSGEEADAGDGRRRLWHAAAFGWRYIRARPPLLRLALYLAGFNTAIALSLIMVTPLVLSFTDVSRLGGVHSVIASGGVVGAAILSVWGGPRNRMTGILLFTLLAGLGLVVGGLRPNVWMVAFGLFPLSFSIPGVNACSQTIWQGHVEPAFQGRVFATRTVLAQGTAPFAFLLAGVLADRIFVPLLLPGGPLASTVGRLLGVGEGRGMGLMMVLMGFALAAMALRGLSTRGLRHLEDELASSPRARAPVGS